ncbi:aldehyde dehydrogenase family protein [soil metagenome]
MLEVHNPFSRELRATIPLADERELDRVVAAAHAAFESFRSEPAFRRADLLQRIASLIESRKAEFARTIMNEAGKPIALAEAEVDRAVWTFISASNEARQFHGETLAADAFPSGAGHFAIAKRFPLGVVYGITPFNFPLNLVAHKVAPAIASGNTIVIKPSPKAPMSARLLAQVIAEAGAPPSIVRIVVCDNALAMRLIDDPRVRFVSFTGSVPVGWQVNEAAAHAKKRATLELGGNAGVIVHGDADIDRAIDPIARGAFAYAGRSCISVQRVFIHESIYDGFLELFVAHVRRKIRCGDPSDANVLVGPMIDPDAQRKTLAAIEAARQSGATVLCGGDAEGPCVQPTVIANARPDQDVCANEIFAPVIVVDRYSDFTAAIARVNDSPFGLQAGVFTRDISLALRAFDELRVGGVMINQVPTFRLENMPYGGVKDSGQGREGVRFAMEEMTELRTLVVRTE